MKTHTTSTLRSLVMEGLNPKQQLSIQEIETWTDVLPEIKEELAKQMKFFARSIFHKSLVKKQLGSYGFIADLNPLTPIFECFKYGFIGSGDFNMVRLL
ncbi:MAG: hypothetical protein EOO92_21965, partial [Pedobacter sp.]